MTSTPRKNSGCIQSASGRMLYPLNPRVQDIDIGDIAHALSNKCRFNGMCREFYSVAQHSVLVSDLVERPFKFFGLMHDGSEYMLPDVPSPIKPRLKGFDEIESGVHDAIWKRFGVLELAYEPEVVRAVKRADLQALAIEARDLMIPNEYWDLPYEADPDITIEPWLPKEAKRRFLDRFEQLRANLMTNEEFLARMG